MTEASDGEPADRVLAASPASRRNEIAAAIGAFVVALHSKGFRDRNLDLRNLLVRQVGPGLRITKIDSPRFRLVRAGRTNDRLAAEDWQRLLPQLAQFEVGTVVQRLRHEHGAR